MSGWDTIPPEGSPNISQIIREERAKPNGKAGAMPPAGQQAARGREKGGTTMPADPPGNVEAERFVLGFILLDDSRFPEGLEISAFTVERHRRIFRAMIAVHARGDAIDRVGIYTELRRVGSVEADSLSYMNDLTEGVPLVPRLLDQHAGTLRDTATRRRIMAVCQQLSSRAALGSEDLSAIIAVGAELFSDSGLATGQTYRTIEDIPTISECGSVAIEYIRESEVPRGAVVAFTGDSASGKSTLVTAFARDARRGKGVQTLILDRENPLAVVADRLRRLGMEDGPGMWIWGGWLREQAPQPDSPIVRRWAAETKGIIVVDSFSAFIEGDQNDAAIVRAFMHQLRRLADLGATVILIHHDGKAETAKDYRGSSDFKAAIDQGYHVTNIAADGGGLGKLLLRPFKSRLGPAGPTLYQYAEGQFVREDTAETTEASSQTLPEKFAAVLRLNPGATARRFDELLTARKLPRNKGREWLDAGVLAGTIRREKDGRAAHYFYNGQAS
jgi:KaiC/GvpD/RAD55 family RecA-like ATPase